jgi:hypothetical protein
MSYEAPIVVDQWVFSFAEESTYKTAIAIASCTRPIGIMDMDMDIPQPEPEFEDHYDNGNAKVSTVTEGRRTFPGKLKWKVQNGQLFKNLMGKLVTTGVGPYTHTFTGGTPDARPLPSITLAFHNDKAGDGFTAGDDICGRASGTKLGDFTLNFEEGRPLMCEATPYIVLVDNQEAFPGTITKFSTKPYQMRELGTISAFGLTIARIKSGSVTVSHSMSTDDTYGQSTPYEHTEGRMKINATFELFVTNDDYWDLALADPLANTTVTLTFTRGASDTFQVVLTNAYPKMKMKKGTENKMAITVEFPIIEDISIVVVDSNSAYPLA